MNYKEAIEFFNLNSRECYTISCEEKMKQVINKNKKYIYFIHWSQQDIYSWGTMSGSSNRLRKSSIMNKKLTGKYDRRVDYLMLLKIYSFEKIYLFENQESTKYEKMLCNKLEQKHCYHGLKGINRDQISRNLYSKFKETLWFKKFNKNDTNYFDEFFNDVFLAKLKHPKNPKRTFYYGDSLEPKFLRTIGKEYLEPSVEKILDVNFY